MSENTLPLEIERKFLIALPDAALLEDKSVKRLDIAQVYLRAGVSGPGRRAVHRDPAAEHPFLRRPSGAQPHLGNDFLHALAHRCHPPFLINTFFLRV